MRRKRIAFAIITIILIPILLWGVCFEFGKKNLVNDFITDDFEGNIHKISIWEQHQTGSHSILIVNNEDTLYEEIKDILSDWEIKRDFFNSVETTNTTYKIVLINNENPKNPLNILIDKNGMINIKGKTYKLVNGNLNELLTLSTSM